MLDQSQERQARLVFNVARILGALRELHDDMTVLQAQALFHVAHNPGITQRELIKLIGSATSTASRTIGLLSEFGSRGTPGLHLIRMEVNLQDRRERNCYLTDKGERLMRRLAECLTA